MDQQTGHLHLAHVVEGRQPAHTKRTPQPCAIITAAKAALLSAPQMAPDQVKEFRPALW